jgi:hypothetical protein
MFNSGELFGGAGKKNEEYSAPESKRPEKESHIAWTDEKAEQLAYNMLISLERERSKETPDSDEVLISWIEDEFTEQGPSEYSGVISRAQLARALKEGLVMKDGAERRKIAIQVADSGPRCILYPFAHRVDYRDPYFFGGPTQEDMKNKDTLKESEEDSASMRQFKQIKREGRSIKSTWIPPYTVNPYTLIDVEKIRQGKQLGKDDEKFYTDLLLPWEEKKRDADTEEVQSVA